MVGVRARWGRVVGGRVVRAVSTYQWVGVREEGGGMQTLVRVGEIRVGVWVRERMQTLVRVGGGVGSGEGYWEWRLVRVSDLRWISSRGRRRRASGDEAGQGSVLDVTEKAF